MAVDSLPVDTPIETTPRMTRRLGCLLAAIALVALGLWCVVRFCGQLQPKRPPPEPAVPPEEPQPPEAPAPSPPRAPRALAIEGSVFGKDLRGIEGLTVACGSETAATDAQGSFAFPSAVRPRRTEVRVLRGSEVLAAYDALTGDEPESDPAERSAAGEDGSAGLPARLERIRWTLNLLDGGDPGRPAAEWFRPSILFAEDWGGRVRLRFAGRTRFPDGAVLSVSLNFDGSRMLSTLQPPVSRAGSFSGEIVSPEGLQLFSGAYELETAYTLLAQDMKLVERWEEEMPDVDWLTVRPPESLVPVFLGDRREAREEDCATAEYYGRALEEVRRLERALKSRIEEILDAAYGLDPAALRRLMDESRYAEIAEARKDWDPALLEDRFRARSSWRHAEFVEGGSFREARWRRFLDEEWRPEVNAFRERHESRAREKYPEASARLRALLENLLLESYAFSSLLVYPAGLPQHPNDFYPDEGWADDLERMEGLVRANFAGLERYRDLCR